jgi:HlyD family secretion protein
VARAPAGRSDGGNMVDIQRKSHAKRRLVLEIIFGVVILGGVVWFTKYLYGLKPAEKVVDKATLYIDTVKRGPMNREVHGTGKLVPEEIRVVQAATSGRVEKKFLEPGAQVDPATILVELSNPTQKQETMNAEWELKTAETTYRDREATLARDQMTQQAEIARMQSEYQQAELDYQAKNQLTIDGLFPNLDLKKLKAAVDQVRNRLEIEKKRMEINKESIDAQLANQCTSIEQAKAVYALRKSQLDQLKIRAGVSGVLQDLSVEIGEQVSMGAKLARVANPSKLKASLNVAETQAKDIQIGQEVSINTRNELIPGKVTRIDPSVKDGQVAVDVALLAALPKGARPDLSVDGTIVLERLENIVYVGHPVQGRQDSQVGLFKLTPDGKRAIRVSVKLGRSAVSTIEVKEGLKPGDQVILSDQPELENLDSIRLE